MTHTHHKSHHHLYLCAPVNALVEGLYEEKIPMKDIKEHGDFGLGTFNNLDGEMVMLDGICYQIPGDGTVHVMPDDVNTPFACVTFYKPLSCDTSEKAMDYPAFLRWIEQQLFSPNICYAIRITGSFSSMSVRSVPKQENYRPLVDVAKEQPVFHFKKVKGTLAGFFTPNFLSSLNVPGIHLHFLSDDHSCGGHLLECETLHVSCSIQPLQKLELGLPMSLDYLTCSFERNTESDLDAAEK